MDIVKLGDSDSAPSEERKVTDLKQGVRNPDRINVFLDGEFAFSLDIAQLLDAKLKIGATLTPSDVARLKRISEFGKLYARTLEWVLMRPRSIKETRDHLRLKRIEKHYEYTDEDIDVVIDKLITKRYLDDRRFAQWFIDNRHTSKGASRRRLTSELSVKGISPALIDEVVTASSRSDESEIAKIITRRANRSTPEKLLRYLVSHGFSYDLAKSAIDDYLADHAQ